MKKIILLSVFICTIMVGCKKESTIQTSSTTTPTINEKIRTVIVNNSESSIDTLNYFYDENGKLSKIISIENGSEIEDNIKWGNDTIMFSSTILALNSNKLVDNNGIFKFEYENGFISKYGIKAGTKLNDYFLVEKDTFLTCVWQNENLISDGFYNYEYYNDKLNNDFIKVFPLSISLGFVSDKEFRFNIQLYNFLFSSFNQSIFGNSSRNLIKKITDIRSEDEADRRVYILTYTFDSKNRIICVQFTGVGYNKDIIKYDYIWK